MALVPSSDHSKPPPQSPSKAWLSWQKKQKSNPPLNIGLKTSKGCSQICRLEPSQYPPKVSSICTPSQHSRRSSSSPWPELAPRAPSPPAALRPFRITNFPREVQGFRSFEKCKARSSKSWGSHRTPAAAEHGSANNDGRFRSQTPVCGCVDWSCSSEQQLFCRCGGPGYHWDLHPIHVQLAVWRLLLSRVGAQQCLVWEQQHLGAQPHELFRLVLIHPTRGSWCFLACQLSNFVAGNWMDSLCQSCLWSSTLSRCLCVHRFPLLFQGDSYICLANSGNGMSWRF